MHADYEFDYAYAPYGVYDYHHDDDAPYSVYDYHHDDNSHHHHSDYSIFWHYHALGPSAAEAPHPDGVGHRDYDYYNYTGGWLPWDYGAPAPALPFETVSPYDYDYTDYSEAYELPTVSEDTEVSFFDTPFTLPLDLYVKAGDKSGATAEDPAHVPLVVVEGHTGYVGHYV